MAFRCCPSGLLEFHPRNIIDIYNTIDSATTNLKRACKGFSFFYLPISTPSFALTPSFQCTVPATNVHSKHSGRSQEVVPKKTGRIAVCYTGPQIWKKSTEFHEKSRLSPQTVHGIP